MSKHTPGPWQTQYRKGADSMNRTEIFSEQYGGIASCDWTPKHCGNGVTETYREANARLIGAAPDLLEKLKRVMSWIDNWSPEFSNDPEWPTDRDAARAAIAKATGVPVFPGQYDDGHTAESWTGMTLRDYFAAKAMQAALNEHSLQGLFNNAAAVAYEIADAMMKAREP